ncbi:MAG: DUF3842 family protein [Clostridiales bacterium]|nr:DUF3842 family protein [Clostridiales bacterium]
MKILVIDGQGGGVGKALVSQLKKTLPEQQVLALGTNALATAAMLKAGAQAGATGEHAIAWQCRDADLILGVTGVLVAGAMMGEVSPGISLAIAQSPAVKILIPSERCGVQIAGTQRLSLDEAVADCLSRAMALIQQQA